MTARQVEGPGKGRFVTHETAAKWLGLHPDSLDRVAQRESDWLAPVRLGRRKMWDWLDIALLAHLLKRRSEHAGQNAVDPAEEPPDPPRKNQKIPIAD